MQNSSNIQASNGNIDKTEQNDENLSKIVKFPKDRKSISRASGMKISMKKTFSYENGVQVSTVKVIVDDA